MSASSTTPEVSVIHRPSDSAKLDHSKLMSKQHSDGGWGLVPIQSRAGRFASFDVADFEKVSGFEAEWKYTPVRELSALLDGALDGGRYDFTSHSDAVDAENISIDWVARTDSRIGSVGKPEERGGWREAHRGERAGVGSQYDPPRHPFCSSRKGCTSSPCHRLPRRIDRARQHERTPCW